MSCCAPAIAATMDGPNGPSDDEVRLLSRDLGEGLRQSDFSVPSIHCGACIRSIETGLAPLPGVESVRVNLSARRVRVIWREAAGLPPLVARLRALGYVPNLETQPATGPDRAFGHLLRALAVAAFSSMNIMMLSGSVWSGADAETRDVLHWLCALLTLPALLYSAQVFYLSAFNALRHGRTNMDVPIAIGILATFALSLYDTATSGDRVYYDAVASLVFFLLIGRTLDHAMREKARSAVRGLARLAPAGALVVEPSGQTVFLPLSELQPGMTISVPAGERLPVDAVVTSGTSTLDRSLLTGESLPEPVGPGETVAAGALNLTSPLLLNVSAAADQSTLARLMGLLEDAELGRNRYRRIADRAAALYAPLVHLAALLAFFGWLVLAHDAHQATTVAVAVLIITCPCALGLAVPMVQVVAARRLFEAGILMKDGAGLERLAEVDTVVFDKTGTLTSGLAGVTADGGAGDIATAAALASHSRHPYALAIARRFAAACAEFTDITDHAGLGVEAHQDGNLYRLGRPDWAVPGAPAAAGTVLSRDGVALARFGFEDTLRPGAEDAIAALREKGFSVEMLSGDRPETVGRLADRLGISAQGGLLPADKLARLDELAQAGRRVLMVGDGLNDTPAMAAAHAAMAPAEAADIGRNAADFVFLRNDLSAVPQALAIATESNRLVRQNLGLATLYNALALPVAIAGLVNPFVAAIAMSLSSVLVVLNALRLGRPSVRPDTHKASPKLVPA